MTVEAILRQGSVFRTAPLTQYDEGQKIHLSGVELPASYLAEFANSEMGVAEQITQTTDTVTIPDKYLTSGNPVYVWIVVVGEDERTTRYEIIVPVRGRGEPDDYTPTPEEQTAIEAAIAALNEAVTAAGVAIEHYPKIEGGYWYVWDVTAGEWISTEVPAQGPQGETGATGATGNGIASAVLNNDYTLTLTFTNGETYTTPSIRGAQGQDGAPGADGYSPTASVSKSNGVATITITDKNGTTTAQVSDGATGQTGPAGADGSPGASAYVWIRYAAQQPTQDSDMSTSPGPWMGIYSGDAATAPTHYTDYTWYQIKGENGSTPSAATSVQVKAGTESGVMIAPSNQHESAFFALAKAAGANMASSSNPVGTYTDAAKVAIQKMLGIYEAPWELIREDEVTNTTEADIEITVDGNGNAFELTDVYIFIYLPTQENSASVGNSGKIEFYYASNEYQALYCSATSQSAGGNPKGAWAMITNDNGAMIARNVAYSTTGTDRNYVYARNRGDTAASQAYLIPGNFTYSKVIIKGVTGTAKYRFYGKRKWT